LINTTARRAPILAEERRALTRLGDQNTTSQGGLQDLLSSNEDLDMAKGAPATHEPA